MYVLLNCGWQFMQESDTRFNLIAPIFQKFPGGAQGCLGTKNNGDPWDHSQMVSFVCWTDLSEDLVCINLL